jgi:hypothetical protein
MARHVVLLEDDPRRIERFAPIVAEILPTYELTIFDAADPMIAWLHDHLLDVSFLSLDHDLPLERDRDCGTGRHVADLLATLDPICPVIIHSSNIDCAAGMVMTLEQASWPVVRVHPWGGEEWIDKAWKAEVRKLVAGGLIF